MQAGDALGQTSVADGFEEIVGGGGIEGGDGVFVVGGDKHNTSLGGGAGCFEAAQAGHANVEKSVLGAEAVEFGDGLDAVVGDSDNFEAGPELLKTVGQVLGEVRLVVRYQGGGRRHDLG